MTNRSLSQLASCCPLSPGVYRLYSAERIVHVGMAAGDATVHSEVLAHASGEYGAGTQAADRVDWEVAPDAILAYRRFLALYAAATYDASGGINRESASPSVSKRHSQRSAAPADEAPA